MGRTRWVGYGYGYILGPSPVPPIYLAGSSFGPVAVLLFPDGWTTSAPQPCLKGCEDPGGGLVVRLGGWWVPPPLFPLLGRCCLCVLLAYCPHFLRPARRSISGPCTVRCGNVGLISSRGSPGEHAQPLGHVPSRQTGIVKFRRSGALASRQQPVSQG